MTTLDEALAPFQGEAVPDWEAVKAALYAREDEIADNIRVIASQLGTYPEFVAATIADVGLGTPPSDEMREMLRRQFAERMTQLQAEIRRLNGEGQ